jgi:hypothetical protein
VANCRVITNTTSNNNDKKQKHKREENEKINQLRLFTVKYESLKTSADLQTSVAAETHLDGGQ